MEVSRLGAASREYLSDVEAASTGSFRSASG